MCFVLSCSTLSLSLSLESFSSRFLFFFFFAKTCSFQYQYIHARTISIFFFSFFVVVVHESSFYLRVPFDFICSIYFCVNTYTHTLPNINRNEQWKTFSQTLKYCNSFHLMAFSIYFIFFSFVLSFFLSVVGFGVVWFRYVTI